MPRTLWRYILVEQWRLVLLSSAVLVVVIAFAVTIKPLADGKLTAAQAVTFMLYAVPPMLAYAVPFAAGFGTTLAFHRLANDRELLACHASGLSHRTVFLPAVLSGLALAVGLGVLNDQIIPRFLTGMEKMITNDIADVMLRSIGEGDSAKFDTMEIYADGLTPTPLEPGSPYDQQWLLSHVAAVEPGPDGAILTEVFARRAWVILMPASSLPSTSGVRYQDDDRVAILHFEDAAGFVDGSRVRSSTFTTEPYVLPSAFRDDPKFHTNAQLTQLWHEPERLGPVRARVRELARQLASVQVRDALRRRIDTEGSVRLDRAAGRSVRFEASGLLYDRDKGLWQLVPSRTTDRIEVEETLSNGGVLLSSAAQGWLRPEWGKSEAAGIDGGPVGLSFELILEDVTIANASGDARLEASTEVPEVRYDRLTLENDPYDSLAALKPTELIREAQPEAEATPRVGHAIDELRDRIASLRREIISKRNERLAMAASCFVMVLTGAVTAVRLRDSLPLVVYLWSFVPALLTLVLISAGQGVTFKHGYAGLPVLWSGVIGLLIYTVATYRAVARH